MIARLDLVGCDPTRLLTTVAGLQIIVWTLTPTLVNSAPPLDVVESYMWGREWVLATYKHPALPSWVLEASRMASRGAIGWPAYLASQLFVAATFALVYLLGRELMDAPRAAAGTLLLTSISAYGWLTPEFNHNVAQLPFWAGLALALWRAVERRSLLWWALAGVFGGVGLYAKLTTVLLLATVAVWVFWDERARRALVTAGPWIGLAIVCVLAAPLALWMVEHSFAPLHYAAERAQRRADPRVHSFVLASIASLVGVMIMLWAAGLLGRQVAGDKAEPAPPPVDPRALRFMAVMFAGPPLLTLIVALTIGWGLRSAWANSMFNMVGMLAVALVSNRFRARTLPRIAASAVALLIVVPMGYALAFGTNLRWSSNVSRVQWPQAEIARRFGEIWARQTAGRPLRIVTGRNWVAGLVGLTAPDVPSIFNHGNPAWSPWITPELVARQGMLIVWDGDAKRLPDALAPFRASHPAGQEGFEAWGGRSRIVINYIVVPPTPGNH
jgi:4-amino-4-deoxy-L-arabinose transferase-like glycosyltransferase